MALNEDDLKEMLNDDDDEKEEKCPLENRISIPSFMLEILKMKSGTLADFLKLSTDLYKAVDNDPNAGKKDEVFKFIKHILSETKNSINQYDYLVALMETGNNEKGK